MLASFLLALREGLEAALIIGIVFGAILKLKRTDLYRKVWQGVGLGVLVSVAMALALNWLGMEFEGFGEQIFEGLTLLLAAGVLTWMILWMMSHGRRLQSEVEAQTRRITQSNAQKGLWILAFLAVFREGIELALFLFAARLTSNSLQTVIGGLLGLTVATSLGWIVFTSTRRLNLRRFFDVTNTLLIVFAAGMIGLAIHELNEAGIIPALIEHVWDLRPVLSDENGLGLLLKALVGYNAAPSLTSVIGYLAYLVGIVTYLVTRKRRVVGGLVHTMD
jgi:high-affinity iron transporter